MFTPELCSEPPGHCVLGNLPGVLIAGVVSLAFGILRSGDGCQRSGTLSTQDCPQTPMEIRLLTLALSPGLPQGGNYPSEPSRGFSKWVQRMEALFASKNPCLLI